MASQEETVETVTECIELIGSDYDIDFDEYDIETQTQGKYRSGTWTYRVVRQNVSLEYWFSSFSSRKEEVDITYGADDDRNKLEKDLRECLSRLREVVKRKKSMF